MFTFGILRPFGLRVAYGDSRGSARRPGACVYVMGMLVPEAELGRNFSERAGRGVLTFGKWQNDKYFPDCGNIIKYMYKRIERK